MYLQDSNSQEKVRPHFKRLFEPLSIKGFQLKNRLVYPALVTGFGANGMVNARILDYYGERADHGVGLIIVEPGMVDVTTMGFMNLGIYDDKFLPGLRQLVRRIHAGGALAGIQLQHTGREWSSKYTGLPILAPSPIPWSPREETPKEMSRGDISHMVGQYAMAARLAKQAGFDLVEPHGAHGYLVGEFFSPLSNQRTDEYGGSLGNRARFAVEIVRAVHAEAGNDMLVGFRLNGSDHMVGGPTIEDARAIASMLVDAGVDLLSVSSGVFGSYPTIVPPYDMPHGCNVPFAEQVKKSVKVPVAVAGRLDDLSLAEEVLESGKADLIALGRSLIADPELPEKARKGAVEDIRRCLACCHCLDGSYEESGVVCTVNPAAGREAEFVLSQAETPKKVAVIGGGLAGLEAARVASLRGHRVVLYERDREAGGQWLLAARPPYKQEFAELVRWQLRQVVKLGVEIRTQIEATADLVADGRPDVAVVATGAEPIPFAVPGVPANRIRSAWNVLESPVQAGRNYLVVGGSGLGLEVADYLSEGGGRVTVVEKLPHVGADMASTVRFHLMNRLRQKGATIMRSVEISRGVEKEIFGKKGGAEVSLGPFDVVVAAVGARPRDGLAHKLKETVREVYMVGDASQPRQAIDAMREGAEIGRTI